ncbi:MAG: hypothetical protein K9L17_01745 [Clostridiales bacterium]|nr:hypothetical protein [Clostridiales bacterium]MCF8021410.1 hypothetical protein [Clostridiales bacterium]
MNQVYQMQQQIQKMRQELNNISQMTSQLQQSEQSNAAQISRLQQHESNSVQQLQRIQQVCNQLNQDLNQIGSFTQQTSVSPAGPGQYGVQQYPYSQMSTGTNPAGYNMNTQTTGNYSTMGQGGGTMGQSSPPSAPINNTAGFNQNMQSSTMGQYAGSMGQFANPMNPSQQINSPATFTGYSTMGQGSSTAGSTGLAGYSPYTGSMSGTQGNYTSGYGLGSTIRNQNTQQYS